MAKVTKPGEAKPGDATGEDEFTASLGAMRTALNRRTTVLTGFNVVTGIVSVGTLSLTLLTFFQGRTAAKQTEKSVNAQVESVAAQLEAMELTKSSVEAQLKQFELQFRPWIVVSAFSSPRLDGKPKDYAVWTTTNVGPVPAYAIFKMTTAWVGANQTPTNEQLFNPPVVKDVTGRTQLGANVPIQNVSDLSAVPADVRAAAKTGAMKLYTCIRAEFVALQETKDQTKSFRFCETFDSKMGAWVIYPPPEVANERL